MKAVILALALLFPATVMTAQPAKADHSCLLADCSA
jgi:hypothetical protein